MGLQECTPNLTTCPAPCNILWQSLGTHRSLSVSVRVFCCRRWTMKTVTATPMMSPMATTPPRIPITPPGGPCGMGFSADKRRNNNKCQDMCSLSNWCCWDELGKKQQQGRRNTNATSQCFFVKQNEVFHVRSRKTFCNKSQTFWTYFSNWLKYFKMKAAMHPKIRQKQ